MSSSRQAILGWPAYRVLTRQITTETETIMRYSKRTCTEHLACQLPEVLRVTDTELVEQTELVTGRPYLSVRFNSHEIGALRDDGFRTYTGGWHEHWVAFAGGAMVPTGDTRDRQGVLRELVRYCDRAAYQWRLALH